MAEIDQYNNRAVILKHITTTFWFSNYHSLFYYRTAHRSSVTEVSVGLYSGGQWGQGANYIPFFKFSVP